MEQDLVTRLLASVPVSNLATGAVGWGERPRGRTGPSVVLQTISAVVDYRHDGTDPTEWARVQIDLIGSDDEQLVILAAAVRAVFESGDAIAGTVTGGTRFYPAQRTRSEGPEAEQLANQRTLFRRSADFEFYFQAN